MKGIIERMSRQGVPVVELHYSSFPGKDSETEEGIAWRKEFLKGFPGGIEGAKWQKEMEMNFAKARAKWFPNFQSILRYGQP
nr:hypothetical protein [Candidatus Aenigmarchaeota archaeon]